MSATSSHLERPLLQDMRKTCHSFPRRPGPDPGTCCLLAQRVPAGLPRQPCRPLQEAGPRIESGVTMDGAFCRKWYRIWRDLRSGFVGNCITSSAAGVPMAAASAFGCSGGNLSICERLIPLPQPEWIKSVACFHPVRTVARNIPFLRQTRKASRSPTRHPGPAPALVPPSRHCGWNAAQPPRLHRVLAAQWCDDPHAAPPRRPARRHVCAG